MENLTEPELRSRSRSKTPFLRSSCDHEHCTEGGDHIHSKSGRRTPNKRSTPVKQLSPAKEKVPLETIPDETNEPKEVYTSPPAHRTRNALKSQPALVPEAQIKTSDYSSTEEIEFTSDGAQPLSREQRQNTKNYHYEFEKVTTTTRTKKLSDLYQTTGTLADLTMSPIHSYQYTSTSSFNPLGRSTYSPAQSDRSTDSSFAELAIADLSKVTEHDKSQEHLPYKLYKAAGEYWNKYPKTDYTYSPLSRDRVELAPGQVAVPNMSRRSLGLFRLHGATTSRDEIDRMLEEERQRTREHGESYRRESYRRESYGDLGVRKRLANDDSSEDEAVLKSYTPVTKTPVAPQRWLPTSMAIAVWTTFTSILTSITSVFTGSNERHRYPYTSRYTQSRNNKGILSRAGSLLAAPFIYIYRAFKSIVTTEIETIMAGNNVGATNYYTQHTYNYNTGAAYARLEKKRKWWPWIAGLLLLPLLTYGSYYSYENFDSIVLPSFSDIDLYLPEFTLKEITNQTHIHMTKVAEVYEEYTTIASDRLAVVKDYIAVVASSCYKEFNIYWNDYIRTPPVLQPTVNNAESNIVTHMETRIVDNPQLAQRISILEELMKNIDNKMEEMNLRLDKMDNIESLVEMHAIKHLQQNLIQIFKINNNDGMSPIYEDIKEWFKKSFVKKDELEAVVRNIERSRKEEIKDEAKGVSSDIEVRMKELVEEYMIGAEKRQKEELLSRYNKYIQEARIESITERGFDVEAVKRIVADMLAVYDADKTGMVDYAMESAGGQVVSTKCTELYQIKTKQYSIFNIPIWISSTSPRDALKPGAMPGECWAFQNFPGYLIVRTFTIVNVTGFSLEHMPKFLAADRKIESAPKNFSIWGLREELDANPHHFGDYMYDENSTAIQFFPVKHADMTDIGGKLYPVGYDLIELRIETNYGNPTYTCLYRFRVHGNPVTDIQPATDDILLSSDDYDETKPGRS